MARRPRPQAAAVARYAGHCTIHIVNVIHDEGHTTLARALDQLLAVVVLVNDDMQQGLARRGLSVPRAHLLWVLHHDGPSTQRALADGLKVTPRNVTALVDGLEETGFVARGPHPTDRRATRVSLTEHGTATLSAMTKAHQQLAESLFGGLESRQLRLLLSGLDHVMGRLQQELAAAAGEAG